VKYFFCAALFLFSLLPSRATQAQSLWTRPPASGTYLSVEALKPTFDEIDPTFLSDALHVFGGIAVTDRVRIVAEVPVSRFGLEGSTTGASSSETTLGNPYLGVVLGESLRKGISVEMGARLPLADADRFSSLSGGLLASRINRLAAFLPDVVASQVLFNYRGEASSPLGYRLRGGP
jgi:hypothetical protein